MIRQGPPGDSSGITDLYLSALCQALALYETICGIVKIHKQRQVKITHPKPERVVRALGAQCSLCGYVCKADPNDPSAEQTLQKQMLLHHEEHHPQKETEFPDPVAGTYWDVAKDGDGNDCLQCKTCGAQRGDEADMRNHLQVIHGVKYA